MQKYYQAKELFELHLSPRNQRLHTDLLAAEKTYSSMNAEIAIASYEQTKGEPVLIRRAKSLAAQFEKMPIYIRNGELLVGNRSAGLGVMPRLPEYLKTEIGPRTQLDDARFEALDIYTVYTNLLGEKEKKVEECLLAGYPAGSTAGFGHIMADYGMVIREGAIPLAEKAEKYAAAFEQKEEMEKRDVCIASSIACRAFAAWGKRYAVLAADMANSCSDAVRRDELKKIAEICTRVPAYPAQSFHEALQALFFAHQAMSIEQQGGSISIGGFDRILLPFYMDDMERGALGIEFVQELVESFYIKLMENAILPREVVNFCNMTIGGCDMNGDDFSNDLTWIALDTIVKTKSTHPLLSFRWHPQVDRSLWERVVQIVGIGLGLPAIFSDPLMMEAIRSWTPEEKNIQDYGVVGCVEPALNGLIHGQTLGGHVNLLLCLELAIHNGCRFGDQEPIGPQTGKLVDFHSMEDVLKAYRIQVEYACVCNRNSVFAAAQAQKECFGYPLMTSFMHDQIEKGKDLTEGIKYNFPTVCITGVTNVVDSLLSLQELVFEGDHNMSEIYEALLNNYAGYEDLRAKILASSRRFGNGSEEFVSLYNQICDIHTEMIIAMPGPRGGHFAPGLWTTSWHVRQGNYTGPSLDGRLQGEPIADCAGPVSGRVIQSPTSIARDMAGIDALKHYTGGYVFNQKFSQSLFDTKEQREKIADYIEVFLKIGGMQMQINVHSRELLLAAQKNPEKHQDLIVRVAGFSAYFVYLDAGVQNEIIARAQVEV